MTVRQSATGNKARHERLRRALWLAACLAVLFGVGHPVEAQQWLTDANARIEQYRKANLVVEVVDNLGQPVPGAAVHAEMKRHTFGFGTAVPASRINSTSADGVMFRQKLLENFNQVVFENDLKWPPWIGLWGSGFNWPATQQALNWLDANNLPTRGHYLSWATLDGGDDYDGGDSNLATLKTRLFNHITNKASTVGNRVFEWDVINHPVGWTGQTYENVLPEGTDVFKQIIDHARSVAPAGMPMWINEDDVIAGGFRADDYERIIDYMIDNGSSPDGIGFQSHFIEQWGRVSNSTPEQVYDRIDRFAYKGVPLRATEFDVDVGTDEAWQGQLMHDYLTVMFSHPAMGAITLWGFWQGSHWMPNAALYRTNWSEKPSLVAYRDLVFNQWWTDETGTADGTGQYDLRAFKGQYDIAVTYEGQEYVVPAVLDDDMNVVVTLPFSIGLLGDYNQNDVVDAADYTYWRDRLGESITLPNSDPNDADGVVTQAEYEYWKSRFGATTGAGSGALASATVPEPSSTLLAALVILLLGGSRRRR